MSCNNSFPPKQKFESNSELSKRVNILSYGGIAGSISDSEPLEISSADAIHEVVIDFGNVHSKCISSSSSSTTLLHRIPRATNDPAVHIIRTSSEFSECALCLPLQVKLAKALPQSAEPTHHDLTSFEGPQNIDLPGQTLFANNDSRLQDSRSLLSPAALAPALACLSDSLTERRPSDGTDRRRSAPLSLLELLRLPSSSKGFGPVADPPAGKPSSPPCADARGERKEFDDCALCLPVQARRAATAAAAAAAVSSNTSSPPRR
jgi:hypothetical protein